jgi:hypothetical protein
VDKGGLQPGINKT